MSDPPLGDVRNTAIRPPGLGLLDMPNEILMNIIENFQVDVEDLPSLDLIEPETMGLIDAGDHWEIESETAEHTDTTSCYRRKGAQLTTLRALCLVCKRISDVATPTLYSSIIMPCPGEVAFNYLSLLLRTVVNQPHLAQLIKYVELPLFEVQTAKDVLQTYVHDVIGWSELFLLFTHAAAKLWGPPQSYLLETLWLRTLRNRPEMSLAALLVGLSPNVTHLKFGTLWHSQLSFFQFFGWNPDLTPMGKERSTPALSEWGPTVAFHWFPKLKRITLLIMANDIHRWESAANASNRLRQEVLSTLPVVPEIAILDRTEEYVKVPLRGLFPELSSVTFHETNLVEGEIVEAVKGCTSLTHFAAVWNMAKDDLNIPFMLSALASVEHTLQHLNITTEMELYSKQTNFSTFRSLRSLVVPHVALFGKQYSDGEEIDEFWIYQKPPTPIWQCLPPKLKTLKLVDVDHMSMGDNSRVWWDFGRDLHRLPCLELVCAQGEMYYVPIGSNTRVKQHWILLINLFAENGVKLEAT